MELDFYNMETNSLITKFMDVKVVFVNLKHLNDRSFWMIDHDSKPVFDLYFDYSISFESEENCYQYYNERARYAESWEWLMPVIDKIESLGYTFMYSKNTHDVHIGEDAHMFSARYMTTIVGKGSTKIESHYNAVINFIKQYNNDK